MNKRRSMPYASMIFTLCGIQALYGIFQFLSTFNVATGSFDNPAGFASCLCISLPFSHVYIYHQRKLVRVIGFMLIICIIIALYLSQSRTSFIYLGFLAFIYLRKHIVIPHKWRKLLPYIAIFSAIIFFLFIYIYKKDSADGRVLIWYCAFAMIIQKWITGWGLNGFLAHYMDFQASFFKSNPNSEFAHLADNIKSPFNELLHICIIGGIPSLILVFMYVTLIIKCYTKRPTIEKRTALLSLIGIVFFSAFSYPFNYPFTWIMLISCSYVILRNENGEIPFPLKVKKTILILLLGASVTFNYYLIPKIQAIHKWKEASDIAFLGNFKKVLPIYEYAYLRLSDNPYFLYNFAAELYTNGDYTRSLCLLNKCRNYMADYNLEILLGDNCLKLDRKEEAITHYKEASFMCPNRFYPLYKMQIIYDSLGNKRMAYILAKQILRKNIKVPSQEINQIKEYMNNWLQENSS